MAGLGGPKLAPGTVLSPGIAALQGGMPLPERLTGAPAPGDADAKTRLNQFCQRYCQRPVTKQDVLYSMTRFGKNECQAVVRLNCMEGQEFAGELCENAKDAEKSAALQAMAAYSAIMDSLPATKPGGKKKSGEGGGGKTGEGVPPGENPALTPKVKLNALCMKIIKRPLQKDETLYETVEVGNGKSQSGYQTTVRFPVLPGDWATKAFAGQVCEQKVKAEQDAASIALAAMEADATLIELANQKPPKKESKGDGKSKGPKAKWPLAWAAGGPNLPREMVTQAPVTATVHEWKGSYGWVKLSEALDHPLASKREGNIYLHKQDLKDGKESLEKGATILVSIYADPSGLGAQES